MVALTKFFPMRARAFLVYWRDEIWETMVAVGEFKVDIITLRGRMPGSEEEITMLYVGRKLNYSHFTKKFFVDPETVKSKKSNLFSFRKAMKAEEGTTDVTFFDVGWPYTERVKKSGDYLELPDWVCMEVALAETWDGTVQNFRKTMRKNIRRLIRKNNYRCVPTNDPEFIENFYETFYVPFIKSRHADETALTPRSVIEQRAHEGTILQVVDDDGPVAAGVYFSVGDSLRLLATGMPEAFLEKPPVAAMQALYYFSMEYAFEKGLKSINFMGTRALPTNGLFQFKRKWGAGVTDEFSIDSYLFQPANNNPRAAEFCERFPFITRNNEALQLVVCSRDETFGDAECAKMLSDYHCGGFEDVKVVHLTDQPSGTSQTLSTEQGDVRVKSCDLENFANSYLHD